MAFTIAEAWQSGEGEDGQNPSDELNYIVAGTAADNADDPPTVRAWAATQVDVSYNGRSLIGLRAVRIAPYTWLVTAKYGANTFKTTGQKSFIFNTQGRSETVYAAKQHIATYTASGAATSDFDGWINPQHGGTVQGTTRNFGGFDFQIILYLPLDAVNESYVSLLFMLTDTVNATTFTATIDGIAFTFDEGECLFNGAQGAIRGYGDLELTLNFSGSPNRTGMTIAGISGVDKRGWEYASVVSSQTETTADSKTFIAPKAELVLVDQLFDEDNWTGLIPS